MNQILVVGSLNTDLVVRAPRFPRPGETISGEDLQIIAGGKGANQAVAAARLGAQVSMLGRVGKDNFGDFLLDHLKSNHVDTTLVQRDDASTGTSIIVVDSNGQNSIVLSAGANGKVTPADVSDVSFSDFQVVLLQLEIQIETVARAAQRAHENGLRVILNPAPAQPIPDELIAVSDFIIPNETELSLLTNQIVTDIQSAEQAAHVLLQRGARNVIVTMGSRGALMVSNTRVDMYTSTHVNTYQVEVVDTTAAGDAFIGGFAFALLQDKSLEEAVCYGCACGALATTRFGAQPSLPTKDEVERLLSQYRQGDR